MKRGLSVIIGSVVLVAVVLFIGLIVFLFGRNFLEKAKERALAEKVCGEISFSVGDFCHDVQQIWGLDGQPEGERNYIQFNGRNNVAGLTLEGFMISIDYGGSIIPKATHSNELNGGEVKIFVTDNIESIDGIKEIKIIPRIKNNREVVICERNYETYKWSMIRTC